MAKSARKVELYLYDMSGGTMPVFCPIMYAEGYKGLWHSSIVVNGWEYYYGTKGIRRTLFKGKFGGRPITKTVDLGTTSVPDKDFKDFIITLKESEFTMAKYDAFKHNCNTFSQILTRYLTGKNIPTEVRTVADRLARSPLGGLYEAMSWILHISGGSIEDHFTSNMVTMVGAPNLGNKS